MKKSLYEILYFGTIIAMLLISCGTIPTVTQRPPTKNARNGNATSRLEEPPDDGEE